MVYLSEFLDIRQYPLSYLLIIYFFLALKKLSSQGYARKKENCSKWRSPNRIFTFGQLFWCFKEFYKDAKKDTVLADTRTMGIAQIIPLDSANLPSEYFKVLSQVKIRDSIVFRVKTDSRMKNAPQGLPTL